VGGKKRGPGKAKLRRAAEQRLRRGGAAPAPPAVRPSDLLHELQVHQAELELQNEELRRAQGALEEARDRYVELYDFAPVGYLTLDRADRISEANLAAAALLGLDRSRLRSSSFRRYVAPADRERLAGHLLRVRLGDGSRGCELLLHPEGRDPFPALLTAERAAPAASGGGSVRCALADITERHRAEAERERRISELLELNQRLEQTQMQLRQADKLAAIGQLAAGVAHEVNNPLTYVSANLRLLADAVAEVLEVVRTTEEVEASCVSDGSIFQRIQAIRASHDLVALQRDLADLLRESREGLDRVTRVVSALRAFAHPDAGTWEETDLHALIESALRIVGSAVSGRAKLVRAFASSPPRLRCRPSQLEEVFMNLLVNGAQACGAGGTITVRTGLAGSEAWVEVEDDGVGIPPEHQARLFEPFFTTKPVGEGTGLGLFLAHGIVRTHGGRLEVRSEVGRGSTFRVVLPVQGPPATPVLPVARLGRYRQ